MTRRRRKAPRKSRKKNTGVGRFIEGMSVTVMILVILVFAVSIAHHILRRDGGTIQVVRANSDSSPLRENSPAPFGLSDTSRTVLTAPSESRPIVVVENGCGRAGLAKEFTALVRGPLDVMDYRDADEYDHEKTLVIANQDHREEAEQVLRELRALVGVGQLELLDTDESVLASIRIVLGRDLADIWGEREGN